MRTVKEYGPIELIKIFSNEYTKEGTLTAELRQIVTITNYYPKNKLSNSIQDNIFTVQEFKLVEEAFTREDKRQAWLDIPDTADVAEVQLRLIQYPNARIYKILSNYPIITEEEEKLIAKKILRREDLANRQVIRHGEKSDTPYKLILDKYGKLQYRRLAFSIEEMEDQDLRNKTANDMFFTEELKAELNGIEYYMKGQKI